MKKFLESASVALGVATIYLSALVGPLVSPEHATVYHWSSSAAELFIPTILDFCIFWMVLTLSCLLARKPGRVRVAVWSGMIFFIPAVVLETRGQLHGTVVSHQLLVRLFTVTLVAWLLLVITWRPALEAKFEAVVAFASLIFVFASIGGLAILPELAWFGWQARSLNAQMPLHHSVAAQSKSAGKPRIIWIVFDELSYEQVYGRRFPGLQLPAFDQLASQAAVFTHTIPAGMLTQHVLPSLMTGDPVDNSRASADGQDLLIHNPDTKAWQKFDEHKSVFQDALNAGYSTAVAGWYNPYCRILPEVLDRCFWAYDDIMPNGMLPSATTLQANMLEPLRSEVGTGLAFRFLPFFRQIPDEDDRASELHIADYKSLVDAVDKVLKDPSANFVLLHMAAPHLPGIYNRATGKFALSHSSYIDNLALTDKCLAHIRSKLEENHEWDSSAIVIMGDHSWRTFSWRNTAGWTKEDEAASQGGKFDDRPAYIVKLPQEHEGALIATPFAALNTRKLLDALLTQNIRSTEDLSVWAQQRR
jgi:hypothetical protein